MGQRGRPRTPTSARSGRRGREPGQGPGRARRTPPAQKRQPRQVDHGVGAPRSRHPVPGDSFGHLGTSRDIFSTRRECEECVSLLLGPVGDARATGRKPDAGPRCGTASDEARSRQPPGGNIDGREADAIVQTSPEAHVSSVDLSSRPRRGTTTVKRASDDGVTRHRYVAIPIAPVVTELAIATEWQSASPPRASRAGRAIVSWRPVLAGRVAAASDSGGRTEGNLKTQI